jgi:hypothetical protein
MSLCKLIALFVGSLFFLASCNNGDDNPVPIQCTDAKLLKMPEGYKKKKIFTMIFLDYTDKRIIGVTSKELLNNAISQYLVSPGDKIVVYFITSNTATRSTLPAESYQLTVADRAPLIQDATLDSIKKCRIYACERLQVIDSIQINLTSKLKEQEQLFDKTTYENSDIAGLFYIANRELSKYGPEVSKTLMIISDLEQNCPGYFNLQNTNFSSQNNIANGDADQDFMAMSSLIDTNNFKSVNLYHIKGDIPEPLHNSFAQNKLSYYWERMFDRFGFIINNK